MIKKRAGLAVATLLVAATSSAFAQNESGFYLLGEGGLLNFPGGPFTGSSTSAPNTGRQFKAGAGYQVNKRFAIEAATLGFTKLSYTVNGTLGGVPGTVQTTSKAGGASLTAVAIVGGGHEGDWVNMLVKVGAAFIRSTSSVASTWGPGYNTSPYGHGNGLDLTYGLGLRADYTNNFSVRFDVDTYKTPLDGFGTLYAVSLGGSYRF